MNQRLIVSPAVANVTNCMTVTAWTSLFMSTRTHTHTHTHTRVYTPHYAEFVVLLLTYQTYVPHHLGSSVVQRRKQLRRRRRERALETSKYLNGSLARGATCRR